MGPFTNLNVLFLCFNTQGKNCKHMENTGNFTTTCAWPSCLCVCIVFNFRAVLSLKKVVCVQFEMHVFYSRCSLFEKRLKLLRSDWFKILQNVAHLSFIEN